MSREARCISFDTRGTGTSRASASSVSLDALVDDVFRVLDAHEVERCILAGESLGGFLAAHAVLRDPSRFDALVTVGAPVAVTPEHTGPLVAGSRTDYPATIAFFVQLCLNEPDASHLHPWGEALFSGADPEVAACLFECCYGHDADWSAINTPTTVVHGTIDAVVSIDQARSIASLVPNARLVELADAGHAPTVTRAPAVCAAISAATRA